jgi:CO/xanthine dehydrogenase FAD-binding subunit
MSLEPHPALPEFDYVRPETLSEASEFLARHPLDARPFLGGTDVFVRMRDGFSTPGFLVDLKHLTGLNDLSYDPHAGLSIGAAVNMNRVSADSNVQMHYPLLAEACLSVASYQLRSRATIAGNICNASPAGDTIGACLVFDATLSIHGIHGMREEPLGNFFLGPGKTTLKAGDFVTAIRFPVPPKGSMGRYLKLGRNKLSDLSIVGITVFGQPWAANPSGYRFRIVLASVAPVPLVASEAEAYLADHPISAETLREAGRLAGEACTPIDDVRGSAKYRKQMAVNLTVNGLNSVWAKLNGEAVAEAS